MRILLPPSETKAAGGAAGSIFDPAALSFPQLSDARARVIDATVAAALAAPAAATAARQRWIDDNRALRAAPTMPAIERYTGVLFDALDADTLDAEARAWVDEHVVLGSALLGLVRARDPIPSYKVSHSSLVGPLRGVWRAAGTSLAGELVVDLRSKAYADLAPVPGAVPVDVVGVDGAALNHWNKHGKGLLVRAMSRHAVVAETGQQLAEWAADADVPLTFDGERLRLVAAAR